MSDNYSVKNVNKVKYKIEAAKMTFHVVIVFIAIALSTPLCCFSELVKTKAEKISTSLFSSSCPDYGAIENAVTKLMNVANTDTEALHIECGPGYDLTGRPKVLCTNGEWESIPRPKCSKRCIPLFLLNGGINFDGRKDENEHYYKSSTATYKCGPGFRLYPENSNLRVCKDGVWTGIQGSCVSDGCERPAEIAYGYFVFKKPVSDEKKVSVGQRAHYSCHLGYTLDGPEILQCVETGGWSPRLPPQCIKLDQGGTSVESVEDDSCPPLPPSAHTLVTTLQGVHTATSAPSGTALEVRCAAGYRDAHYPCDTSTVSCVDGAWRGRVPNCEPVDGCQAPLSIEHGTLFGLAKNGRYQVNAEVAYTCEPGYLLSNNEQTIFTCKPDGCWMPQLLPKCTIDNEYFRESAPQIPWNYINTDNTIIISLVTALGAMLVLIGMGACLVVVCRRQRRLTLHRPSLHRSRRGSSPSMSMPATGVVNGATLLHDPDRVALIAFADGVTLGESLLPSYEEAIREQRNNMLGSAGLLGCRTIRPHWGPPRRTRGAGAGPGDAHVTRQSSSTSHSASLRSGGDSMGSTDTMNTSEVSTNVTLDTVSSHTCSSGSQNASCRGIFGSLASFDTSSVHNTEGVPLLEENELDDSVLGSTLGLSIDQQVQDSVSFKYRRTSPDLAYQLTID